MTCKFVKGNPATGQIDEDSGYFRSLVETIDESTDLFLNSRAPMDNSTVCIEGITLAK